MLIVLGFATESDITRCLAEEFGVKLANVAKSTPAPNALQIVPAHFALTRLALPISFTPVALHVIISDPFDLDLIEELQQLAGLPVEYSIASPSKLKLKIESAYQLPCLKVRSEVSVKRAFRNGSQPDRDALLSALENFGDEPVSVSLEIPSEVSTILSPETDALATDLGDEEASFPIPEVSEILAEELTPQTISLDPMAEDTIEDAAEAPGLGASESPTPAEPLESLSDDERLAVELASLATELSLSTLESINAEAA